MRTAYTKEFRESAISKVLLRDGRPVQAIADECGLPKSTLVSWVAKHGMPLGMKKQKGSKKWKAEEKLRILIETGSLSESDLGAYLRREGLYSHQLTEWRSEIVSLLKSSTAKAPGKDARDEKIKNLEKEVLRKDKALAEASALLILQKKVNLIWGDKDEDEK